MEDEQGAINRSLISLTQFFVNDGTLGDTLLRVCEMICSITPSKCARITMVVEGKLDTAVFTDPEAPEIDQAQYSSGEGPCVASFHDQKRSIALIRPRVMTAGHILPEQRRHTAFVRRCPCR